METENWKDIPGYEGLYQVSNLGNIKSLNFNRKKIHKLLKLVDTPKFYKQVVLYKNKKGKNFLVHRLVGLCFIVNLQNKEDINHINGITYDNRVSNLEWVSRKENIIHSFKILGRKNNFQISHPMKGKFGKYHNRSVLVNQYDLNGNFIKNWSSMSDIERELGIKSYNISKVCRNILKSIGGFIWKYNKNETV